MDADADAAAAVVVVIEELQRNELNANTKQTNKHKST